MKWTNTITDLLRVRYPIVQAPMFGVTTPEMVAAAAAAGTLGSLALADLPGEDCLAAIQATRRLTGLPFAVNIFVHEIPPLTGSLRQDYDKACAFLEKIAASHGLDVELPGIDSFRLPGYREQIEVLEQENCPVVSFTFGNLNAATISRLKSRGVILIGTCTSVTEAIELEAAGIDIICVQGLEAGGHRGSFGAGPLPEIGGMALLPRVKAAVKVPLLYAGGIYNASGLLAAQTLGAAGFQVGSLLVASSESALLDFEKDRLDQAKEEDIILTRSFSGRYARGLSNTFIEAVEHSGTILPYPYQNKLTGALRKAARAQKNAAFVNIWAGQTAFSLSRASAGNILRNLIADTEHYFTKHQSL